jgi:hypothetical protein
MILNERRGLAGVKAPRPAGPAAPAGEVRAGAGRGAADVFFAEVDATLGQVVRGHFQGDLVAGQDADAVLAHLAGEVRRDFVAVFQRHEESRVGQHLVDGALHVDEFFLGHSFTWVSFRTGSSSRARRTHDTASP